MSLIDDMANQLRTLRDTVSCGPTSQSIQALLDAYDQTVERQQAIAYNQLQCTAEKLEALIADMASINTLVLTELDAMRLAAMLASLNEAADKYEEIRNA